MSYPLSDTEADLGPRILSLRKREMSENAPVPFTIDQMKKYTGSCHCQAIRFVVEVDLSAGTLRCNCSFCRKVRCWTVRVPRGSFELVSGESAMSQYQFGARREQHYFCKHCGIRPFGLHKAHLADAYYGVSVSCLDNVADETLSETPIQYLDGINDDWNAAPAAHDFL